MELLLRHEFFASVTVFVQQFAQEFTPPLSRAQNQAIALGIIRREVPGIYKTMDVAFCFASRFDQCPECGALENLLSQQSPSFRLVLPNGVVRKFWCVVQCVEIVG